MNVCFSLLLRGGQNHLVWILFCLYLSTVLAVVENNILISTFRYVV